MIRGGLKDCGLSSLWPSTDSPDTSGFMWEHERQNKLMPPPTWANLQWNEQSWPFFYPSNAERQMTEGPFLPAPGHAPWLLRPRRATPHPTPRPSTSSCLLACSAWWSALLRSCSKWSIWGKQRGCWVLLQRKTTNNEKKDSAEKQVAEPSVIFRVIKSCMCINLSSMTEGGKPRFF